MFRSLTFALFKPDVFLRKILKEVLNFITSQGFQIVDYYFRKMDQTHYELMCQNTFSPNLDNWRVNQKVYSFGPCLGLLLSRSEMVDATVLLNQCKGSALPYERTANSFRSLFKSRSRVFNLIHVADKQDQAMQEALSWFKSIDENARNSFSVSQIFKDGASMGYECLIDIDPEKAFLNSKIRFMYALKKKYKGIEVFDEFISFYTAWKIAIQKSTCCWGIEGTVLIEWQRLESQKFKMLPIYRELQWFSNYVGTKQIASPDNYLSLLDLSKVFLFDLESYLITLRLKYQRIIESKSLDKNWSVTESNR